MAERVFAMPDLGEGLEEGEVVAWLVEEGQRVELNQPLVEVETAKATVEIPSPFAGVIARLHGTAGEAVRVGAPLVTFADGDTPADPGVGRTEPAAADDVRARATPAVRKLAKTLGVDIAAVAPGPSGRITAEDVQRAASGGPVPAAAETPRERVPLTPVRRAIAENLARQAAIPAVTTFRTVDCTAMQGFRRELGTSPLPVFVAALCRVAGDHPLLNASWAEDAIDVHATVNAGIAADTERGLVVPVLRDAGSRGVGELAEEIRALAEAARANALAAADLAGATIGISNTGSYGSEAGTPLLTPGCAVTIAMGVIAPRPLVVDGAVVARDACTLSLTFDHRVLDGATAGHALTDLVALLESAERLGGLPR